jgi:hypothetical protein
MKRLPSRLALLIVWIAAMATVLAIIFGLYSAPSSLTGVGSSQLIVKTEKQDTLGRVIETTTITTPQEPKTLWDWMSLLGVPLVLTILGYKLQQLERAQTIEHGKEEALLNYLGHVSDLLIEKNLIAKAKAARSDSKKNEGYRQIDLPDRDSLDAAKDVIRARTLSILRLLGNDGDRKGSVISFLVEANVISQLRLNLRDADLTGADLRGINLKDAMLNGSNLTGANFKGANLQRVALQKADLSCAIFDEAILVDAKLTEAKLWRTRLRKANLRDAVLNKAVLLEADLTDAELQPWGKKHGTLLRGADLHKAILKSANLTGVYLGDAKNLTSAQVLQSGNWDKAIFTKAAWNHNNKCWDVEDENDNKKRIDQFRINILRRLMTVFF